MSNVEGIRAAALVVRHMDNHDPAGSTSMSENGAMSAGEARAGTGATRAQLRYWEARGIVSPVIRQHNRRAWRLYPQEQVERIRRMMRLLGMGMTLQGAVRSLPALEAREKRLVGNAFAEATTVAVQARAPEAATRQDSDSTNG
jgi:DNA-binding transcriptional MerR regulator